MHWTELWFGESAGAKAARLALTPASWLYALGWSGYLQVYKLGMKKPQEPHTPVVVIGNLTVGGTGKSPVTLHVADVLREMGTQVVIGCSGYGSPASEGAQLAPDGELKAKEWGDEPAMVRWLRPGVPIIVGRRRVLAAEICHREFPEAVLLMDDGFQHMPLKKHVSILLDPPSPNHRTLPAGPYREPWSNRKRADLVLPNGMKVVTASAGVYSQEGEMQNASEVAVICALGSPDSFLRSLQSQGFRIGGKLILPDHDPLTDPHLLQRVPGDMPIVVTAKDWVKLRERPDLSRRKIWIARHEVAIEPADAFRAWLKQKLDEV